MQPETPPVEVVLLPRAGQSRRVIPSQSARLRSSSAYDKELRIRLLRLNQDAVSCSRDLQRGMLRQSRAAAFRRTEDRTRGRVLRPGMRSAMSFGDALDGRGARLQAKFSTKPREPAWIGRAGPRAPSPGPGAAERGRVTASASNYLV